MSEFRYPNYIVTGNGPTGGISVRVEEPAADGVPFTQADKDNLVTALCDWISTISGVTTVFAQRYEIATTDVTP